MNWSRAPLPNVLFWGSIGLFAWQLHGWIAGLIAVAAYYIATAIISWGYVAIVLRRREGSDAEGSDFAKTMLRIRWITWLLGMIVLSLSGAEFMPAISN